MSLQLDNDNKEPTGVTADGGGKEQAAAGARPTLADLLLRIDPR